MLPNTLIRSDKMTINKPLEDLRNYMKQENVDICIIYSTDYHNSEYISDYFKFRDYISGFTGSAATMLISSEDAYLWTDGRYFLQAAKELENSGIELCKSGEKDVPEPEDYLAQIISSDMTLGIDARTVPADMGAVLSNIVQTANATIKTDFAPADHIWIDRPQLPCKLVSILENKYAGKSADVKIKELKDKLELKENDAYILSSLDDIAWLLNLRGKDILYNPVFYSYLYIDNNTTILFANKNSFSDEIYSYLNSLNVTVRNYEEIFEALNKEYSSIYIDPEHSNFAIYLYATSKASLISINNPTIMMKAVKNETECNNLRYCNELDGAAVVRFLMWIEEAAKSENITEYTAGLKLDSIRTDCPDCSEPSFDTICGYAGNGAIIHYSAPKTGSAKINAKNSLLVDSGGQYKYGTTDITRTFALGEVSDEYKKDFTLVLKGMLALQNTVFPEGANGANLDIMARQYLWRECKTYNHGTGHGIGYFLNVHEGPVRISWSVKKANNIPLEAGMVTSNEPGIYIENKYGIRIENMMLCKKIDDNEFGSFLGFEPLTYAPIDLNSIDVSLLNEDDKKALNDYHKLVYDKVAPHLNKLEKSWLQERTKAI